jgi:DNA invertase Pin-like site-specific DNA recombinase
MEKQKRVAIYCRVSTEGQYINSQIEELKNIALLQKYMVYDVYSDKVSGTKDSRPELNRLMFDMRKGLFDAVMIYKLDRLGRSLKHLITVCEEFHNKGIDLIVTSQGIDTSTATGKLLFNILGSVAEFEKELISERTKLGQKKNRDLVGKRGKDKSPRKKGGYYLRYQKKGGMVNA